MKRKLWTSLLCLTLAAGCGGEEGPGAPVGGQSGTEVPDEDSPEDVTSIPAPTSVDAMCIISADCPAGTFCDLGECIQTCSSENPCAEGSTCSARGRCIESGTEDHDPPPVTEHQGSLEVSASAAFLTGDDRSFEVKLSSSSDEPVRYRVAIDAPHLSLEKERGEFVGETTLRFAVDPSAVAADMESGDAAGSVKVFTTLGEKLVSAPIQVGLDGSYQGALVYDGGQVPLGEARITADVIEQNGNITLQFDPSVSLLFPETEYGPARGFGRYDAETGAHMTVNQRIDAELGGERNHFGRDIGRRIQLNVKPTGLGRLEGSFEETIYGLFEQPVKLTGRVYLRRLPGAVHEFELQADPAMPEGVSFSPTLEEAFGVDVDCTDVFKESCDDGTPSVSTLAAKTSDEYSPIVDALSQMGLGEGLVDHADIARDCEAGTYAGTASAWGAASNGNCSWTLPLACGVRRIANQGSAGSASNDGANTGDTRAFQALTQRMLGAPLLVAQEHLVQALKASFSDGLSSERSRYERAAAVLGPVATWMLQPAVIQFLYDMNTLNAQGPNPLTTESADDTFKAGRALATLLRTSATLDGERIRISGIGLGSSQPELVQDAQARALITYLETAVLLALLDKWEVGPENIAAHFTGVLSPLDRGFAALLQGPTTFGVPDGFIPFVWRPEDVAHGATNFEQMLHLASETVMTEGQLETQFIGNLRTFEQNQAQLRSELHSVVANYDSRIADLCGPSFDPDAPDYAQCGANDAGDIGLLNLQRKQAEQRYLAAESRIRGMADKIAIDEEALARTQAVRQETLKFIDQNGRAMRSITMAQGAIDATVTAAKIASNASLFNGGAPLAAAAVAFTLELQRAHFEALREELQTAQTMRIHADTAKVELINGMAAIKKQVIDLHQVAIEAQQDLTAKVEATQRIVNALESVKRMVGERRQALEIVEKNPINDPSYRLLRDVAALQVVGTRARAQRQLYLAGRALEYEINVPIGTIGSAVLGARNHSSLQVLKSCLSEIHNSYRVAFGSPQGYSSEVSVREMLGITGERIDEVTGQVLSPGEQLRMRVLKNKNLDEGGALTVEFSTNLLSGNGLWSTDVCSDRITGVQAQLVGDFLGDNEAQVNVSLTGAAVMRRCDSDELNTWSMGDGQGGANAFAVVQAGVNGFGSAPANTSLFGQSVARPSWRIVIQNGQDAPTNADLDLSKLEDIVLRVEHQALPRRDTPLNVDLSCLMSVH